mgnify:CR=1 FL=1
MLIFLGIPLLPYLISFFCIAKDSLNWVFCKDANRVMDVATTWEVDDLIKPFKNQLDFMTFLSHLLLFSLLLPLVFGSASLGGNGGLVGIMGNI